MHSADYQKTTILFERIGESNIFWMGCQLITRSWQLSVWRFNYQFDWNESVNTLGCPENLEEYGHLQFSTVIIYICVSFVFAHVDMHEALYLIYFFLACSFCRQCNCNGIHVWWAISMHVLNNHEQQQILYSLFQDIYAAHFLLLFYIYEYLCVQTMFIQ